MPIRQGLPRKREMPPVKRKNAMKDIEKQLELIDEFFNETPKETIDKMMEEVLRECPDETGVSFDDYCELLPEFLGISTESPMDASVPVDLVQEEAATVVHSMEIPETAVNGYLTGFTSEDNQLLAA